MEIQPRAHPRCLTHSTAPPIGRLISQGRCVADRSSRDCTSIVGQGRCVVRSLFGDDGCNALNAILEVGRDAARRGGCPIAHVFPTTLIIPARVRIVGCPVRPGTAGPQEQSATGGHDKKCFRILFHFSHQPIVIADAIDSPELTHDRCSLAVRMSALICSRVRDGITEARLWLAAYAITAITAAAPLTTRQAICRAIPWPTKATMTASASARKATSAKTADNGDFCYLSQAGIKIRCQFSP